MRAKYRAIIASMKREVELGEYDSFRLAIKDIENEAKMFFLKFLASAGFHAKRPFKSLMLGLLALSIFEDLGKKAKFSLPKIVEDLWEVFTWIGDLDHELEIYTNEDVVETALEKSHVIAKTSEQVCWETAFTIIKFTEFLLTHDVRSFEEFSTELSDWVLKTLVRELPDDIYHLKAYYVGKLLVTASETSKSGAVEKVRLSLLTLPRGNQRVVNNFLAYLIYVLQYWKEYTIHLHVPVEPDIVRVLKRLFGDMSSALSSSVEYDDEKYNFIQEVFRVIFPEKPVTAYVLKYVRWKWCKTRNPKCSSCPLMSHCSYYLQI